MWLWWHFSRHIIISMAMRTHSDSLQHHSQNSATTFSSKHEWNDDFIGIWFKLELIYTNYFLLSRFFTPRIATTASTKQPQAYSIAEAGLGWWPRIVHVSTPPPRSECNKRWWWKSVLNSLAHIQFNWLDTHNFIFKMKT